MDYQKLIMNKKGMLVRDYIVVLIIFSAIAGLGALMVSDLTSQANGYNVVNVSDPSFDSAYNKLESTRSLVDTSSNASRTGLGKLLGSGADNFFSSTLVVLDLAFGSFTTVNSVFASMSESFGIPSTIANIIFPAILAILTTIIVFVVISSLTRSKM